jgi:16S rRNA (guanine527-N7)-methyltransferase
MINPLVTEYLKKQAIPFSEEQIKQLAAFQENVLIANKKMNLTTITSDEDFAVKHFIDSLSLLPLLPKKAFSLLDIGTGAGFPGVVLKILRPDINLVLLDSQRKRLVFLAETLDVLNIKADCVHARAEEFPRLIPGIEFDVVTARAVARLEKLYAYALPLVTPGGLFLAMKGPDVSREIDEADAALKKYRGTVKSLKSVQYEEKLNHTIIVVKKG